MPTPATYRVHSFERHWNNAPPGHKMFQDRVERYDSLNGLFHAPTEYRYEPLGPIAVLQPDTGEIGRLFLEFVRGEFGAKSSRGECPETFRYEAPELISFRVLLKYVERCESELVFSGLASGIRRSQGTDMIAQIYELLSNPLLGNKDNRRIGLAEARALFEPLISEQKRIFFVVPGFPFKDQNPFRTNVPASHVDIGEIALLTRLHVLTIALYQVHPFGVDWVVVSDGTTYAPILRISSEDVSEYQRQLRAYRDLLNIYGSVALLDLRQLCLHLGDANGESIFDQSSRFVEGQLLTMVQQSEAIKDAFRVLVRGIKWNMNYRDLIDSHKIDWSALWAVLNSEEECQVPEQWRSIWKEFDDLAAKAALAYAACNICIRLYDLYRILFPSSVRATTHAKPGQVAIPMFGSAAPWNGVGIIGRGDISANAITVEPLYRASRHSILRPKLLGSGQHPIGYEPLT